MSSSHDLSHASTTATSGVCNLFHRWSRERTYTVIWDAARLVVLSTIIRVLPSDRLLRLGTFKLASLYPRTDRDQPAQQRSMRTTVRTNRESTHVTRKRKASRKPRRVEIRRATRTK